MRVRQVFVATLAATAVLLPAAGAAQAAAAPAPTKAAATTAKVAPSKPVTVPVKPTAATVPFTVVGTVLAVDVAARTVTVAGTGGMRALRGTPVTIAVAAAAKIVVAGADASLASVKVGKRATVVGVRSGVAYTAKRITA
jgi:hypothetical protein